MWSILLSIFLATAFCYFVGRLLLSTRGRQPPGPSGLPLLGIALKHPKEQFWKTYADWQRLYAPQLGVISFQLLRRRVVVLNNVDAATELLVKRGTVYSDRPFPIMAGVLMKREKSIFMMSTGTRLTRYRRLMKQSFGPGSSQNYASVLEDEALNLVGRLLHDPQTLEINIRRQVKSAIAIILKIGYGYTVEDVDDQVVALAEEAARIASLAAAPGKWLVDTIPILRFVPKWFPGASFQRKAEIWGQTLKEQSRIPHEFVKSQMAAGTALPSFTADNLAAAESGEDEDIIRFTAAGFYGGGVDTTTSAIKSFILAMILHPEIQKRARDELNQVIGQSRLPALADRESLPYLESVMKEVFRWNPPAPLALPHLAVNDDKYEGYFIPKDTMVFPNIWSILHNSSMYPHPEEFSPSRHLELSSSPDPLQYVFGFGRRKCPGSYIGEASVFIQMALLLYLFEIHPVEGKKLPVVDFTTALISHPKDITCRLEVTSSQKQQTVEHALVSHGR